MRPLGEYLSKQGYTVSAPLLPGHGTSVEDLAGRKWHEWAASVESAYLELIAQYDPVFVAGLSLGALLAINLAAEHRVGGLALFSPAIFVTNPLMRFSWLANLLPITIPQKSGDSDLVDPEADGRIWCYQAIPGRAAHQVNLLTRRVRKLIHKVQAPTLVVMSKGDGQIKFKSGPYVIDHIEATDKELVTLYNSGHNVLADQERGKILKKTIDFFDRLSA